MNVNWKIFSNWNNSIKFFLKSIFCCQYSSWWNNFISLLKPAMKLFQYFCFLQMITWSSFICSYWQGIREIHSHTVFLFEEVVHYWNGIRDSVQSIYCFWIKCSVDRDLEELCISFLLRCKSYKKGQGRRSSL